MPTNASAEQGGNLPVRTLLVGGPKHGEWINLAVGQATYEFTEVLPRSPWPETREYAGHIYTLDPKLTVEAGTLALRQQIFVHAVIADKDHGATRQYEHTLAVKKLAEAAENAKKWDERLQAKQEIVRTREIAELQEMLEAARQEIGRLHMLSLTGSESSH